MKKLTNVLLTSAIVLGLTACASSPEAPNTDEFSTNWEDKQVYYKEEYNYSTAAQVLRVAGLGGDNTTELRDKIISADSGEAFGENITGHGFVSDGLLNSIGSGFISGFVVSGLKHMQKSEFRYPQLVRYHDFTVTDNYVEDVKSFLKEDDKRIVEWLTRVDGIDSVKVTKNIVTRTLKHRIEFTYTGAICNLVRDFWEGNPDKLAEQWEYQIKEWNSAAKGECIGNIDGQAIRPTKAGYGNVSVLTNPNADYLVTRHKLNVWHLTEAHSQALKGNEFLYIPENESGSLKVRDNRIETFPVMSMAHESGRLFFIRKSTL